MRPVVVITGNIASGKTLVSQTLTEKKYPVLSADDCVQQILKDKASINQIQSKLPKSNTQRSFKENVREALYGNSAFKSWYLPWIHHLVGNHVQAFVESMKGPVFLDIPLYFEQHSLTRKLATHVWLVWTPVALRIHRWQSRFHASFTQMKRIAAWQIPDEQKFRNVDLILLNTAQNGMLRSQITHALKRL